MLPVVMAALLAVQSPDTVWLSLVDAMNTAREQNTAFLREQLDISNATLRMGNARARRYYPYLSARMALPTYRSRLSRASSVNSEGQVIEQIGREERRSLGAGLTLSQPLPTGGTLRVSGDLGSDQQPLLDPVKRYAGSTSLGISLSQEFFGVNRSIRDYRLANESFARSQAEFVDRERDIARNVIGRYFDLVKARKQALIDSVTFLRDSLRNQGTRTPTGAQTITEVDSLKFELEVARSAFNKRRSQQRLRETEANLNQVLAFRSGTVIVPDTVTEVEPVVPDLETGLAQAYERRFDLQLARMSVDNREAALRDARRRSPVTLSLEGTLGFDGSSVGSEAYESLADAYGRQSSSKQFQVVVSVPLFDRFEERNAVAEAHNDLRRATLGLEDSRRAVDNSVRLAAQRLSNAGAQLVLAERKVDITRRTMTIQTQRFEAGNVGSLEFLSDQNDAREAEISLIDAQVEVLLATEEWRRAIGERSLIAGDEPPQN